MGLNNEILVMWDQGLFALRPISYNQNMTELEVGFHWQANQGHQFDDFIPITKLPVPSSGLTTTTDGRGRKYNLVIDELETIKMMKTGDRFIITTDDPKNLPLPSMELLELLWHLQRIASISAAGGDEKLDVDDDDEYLLPATANHLHQW